MTETPGLRITDWWVRQAALRLAVIEAARTYASYSHVNLAPKDGYAARKDARAALLDALVALDDAEAEWLVRATLATTGEPPSTPREPTDD